MELFDNVFKVSLRIADPHNIFFYKIRKTSGAWVSLPVSQVSWHVLGLSDINDVKAKKRLLQHQLIITQIVNPHSNLSTIDSRRSSNNSVESTKNVSLGSEISFFFGKFQLFCISSPLELHVLIRKLFGGRGQKIGVHQIKLFSWSNQRELMGSKSHLWVKYLLNLLRVLQLQLRSKFQQLRPMDKVRHIDRHLFFRKRHNRALKLPCPKTGS